VCYAHPIKLIASEFAQIKLSRENHKKGLKNNCGRLIDFLSQISKPSYFNLLGLANLFMPYNRGQKQGRIYA